ncbi:hypothetical protein GEMRC1_009826 [Eukaryota sp. GEM-RC1]
MGQDSLPSGVFRKSCECSVPIKLDSSSEASSVVFTVTVLVAPPGQPQALRIELESKSHSYHLTMNDVNIRDLIDRYSLVIDVNGFPELFIEVLNEINRKNASLYAKLERNGTNSARLDIMQYVFRRHVVRLLSLTLHTVSDSTLPLIPSTSEFEDPLQSCQFHPVESMDRLNQSIKSAFDINNLLSCFHSNVLPVIGSTGCGKSRLVREVCSNLGNDPLSENIHYRTLYLTFPRLHGSVVQNSWPKTPVSFSSWLKKILNVRSSVLASVMKLQALLVSMMMESTPNFRASEDNWTQMYDNVKERTEQLLSKHRDEPLQEFSVSCGTNFLNLPLKPQTLVFVCFLMK